MSRIDHLVRAEADVNLECSNAYRDEIRVEQDISSDDSTDGSTCNQSFVRVKEGSGQQASSSWCFSCMKNFYSYQALNQVGGLVVIVSCRGRSR